MKHSIIYILGLLLFSCSDGSEKNVPVEEELKKQTSVEEIDSVVKEDVAVIEEKKGDKIENFTSQLHPEKLDWYADEIYADTLKMIEFNTDYDYSFLVFENRKGVEVVIHAIEESDPFVPMEIYLVKWKIGQYAEAGEDDALYYKEKLVELFLLDMPEF